MSATDTLISVIIPCYNREGFIGEAIQSVLNQRCHPVEVVVVDDGSTDHSKKIIEQFGNPVRYVFQENRGPSSARNTGLRHVNGEFVGFLDADDLWPENRLVEDLAVMNRDPDLGFVIGCTRQVCCRGRKNGDIHKEETIFNLLIGAALYRSSAFTTVGNFTETMKFCEDLDWFLRAREHGIPFRVLEKISLIYRVHENNMSNDRKQVGSYILRAFKRSLDRNLAQGNKTLTSFLDHDEAARLKSFLARMNRAK